MWVNNDSRFARIHSTDSSEIICEYDSLIPSKLETLKQFIEFIFSI